jgi:hypothetical protein
VQQWQPKREPPGDTEGIGPRSGHELKSASHVQDEVSSWQLGRVRSGTRTARRHHAVAHHRRDCRLETCTIRQARRAEEVLGSGDRDSIDSSSRIQVACPSSLWVRRGIAGLFPFSISPAQPLMVRQYRAVNQSVFERRNPARSRAEGLCSSRDAPSKLGHDTGCDGDLLTGQSTLRKTIPTTAGASFESGDLGFRVSSVPEPGVVMGWLTAVTLAALARRRARPARRASQ